MSIKVKGFLKDVGGASRVTKLREENFAKGSPIPDPHDPIRELADKLHPASMQVKCVDIRQASPSSRTYRFESVTFQVPMQYWPLQHRTLLLSPVTSTTGYCFCFGSVPSFFLESFVH